MDTWLLLCQICLGCHTQAKSLDELIERIKEAIILCLEVQSQSTDNLEFIGLQRVAVEI